MVFSGRVFGVALCTALAFIVSGCDAPGPSSSRELAVQGILSGAISPNGNFAVIGSIHHGGSGWDLMKGERLYDWNLKSGEKTAFRAVAISGDARRAITVEDRSLAVWDTTTGQSLNFWQASDKILSIALDQEGRFAAIGQQNNQAVLFDIRSGAEKFVFSHGAEVYAVAIDAQAGFVMTGADDFSAVIWSASTGQPVHRFQHANQVKAVGLSPDGTLAFSAAQREKGKVYDVVSGDVKATIPLDYENFTAVRFTADNSRLLLGTFRGDIYLFSGLGAQKLGHWKAKPRKPWGPASSNAVLDLALRGSSVVSVLSDGMQQTFPAP
jgi:WD40 repeat protein